MRVSIALFVLAAACRPNSSFDYLTPPSGTDGRSGLGMLDPRLATAMRATYKAQASKVEAPMGLQPSDGSELVMKALSAKVDIDGPLAHTELHFTFHNAEPRVREGRFRIELPAGAAIGRFAMLVNGKWREARVVSRDKGRQVYEGFLHQKVDPALLEQDLGNQFSARVFPIPASADKEIIIGYDQLVSAEQPYTLGLKGLPAIPKLTVAIAHDHVRTDYNLGGNRAPDDIVSKGKSDDVAVSGNGAFVARIAPPVAADGFAALDRTLILVDTSASRATVMGKQVEIVRRLVADLPRDATIAIAAFDHEVSELYRGPAHKAGGAIDRVFDHGALGASDLGGALARAAASGMMRVVLVGDGMPTLGETDAGKLASRIRGSAIARFDALQVSGTVDRDLLAVLVRSGKQPGAIVDGRDPKRALRQLTSVLAPEVPIAVAGATDVWPKTTRGLAPGEPIWVSGRAGAGAKLSITVGAREVVLVPRSGNGNQIERAVARAELADLADTLAVTKSSQDRGVLEARVEKVALDNNLVSARTSLLVLETDADELRTLGPRIDPKTGQPVARTLPPPSPPTTGGEVIRITSTPPTIDPASTRQGITIDRNYVKNIPVPGRTFESALGAAAGSQGDRLGVRFSGSTSLENQYYVDGVNTTGLTFRTTGGAFGKSGSPEKESPYTGVLGEVMLALARNERDRALEKATRWRLDNPGDVAAVIALGEALEARGAGTLAARAYGSLIDLYPNRDDIVRAAAERLDRIGTGARKLAIDGYRRALRERPDHLSSYRLLAFALVRDARPDEALDVVLEGRKRATNSIGDVLLQDARVIAAHLAARDPGRESSLRARIGADVPSRPSMHIVLSWETDANDVDLHVIDRHGNTASYSSPKLKTGGQLLADLTDGFGPEMFSVDNPKAFPYSIGVHYYNRGPMGLGIGTVQVIRHDGHGNLNIEDRPFVLQKDGATIGLGIVK